ncbi:NAD(P)/FAD-dependent oxidoreductase [Allorhizobium borbori]|uniref:Gamma-glutamylputrescine oxidase n=1 Tax=Allorhizobium borbori TaxID=485907 RepID=A0A7W6K5E9_9HYPH|nr:FAD-binding oxidoreductase [Allorhizobium borbori]MBB4104626.1 gamma-glutamylputrescine oxidase [Allorhizobium borbori]PZU20297.1 MAG: FAD-dependent oxidoreductase [Shinella sp.]
MLWQSPIAPGISWYQADAGARPDFAALDGSRTVDVAIVGGGFTGLQAAYALAKAGVSVALIEAHHLGDGASGRNGGQFGTGQRWWPEEMEAKLGFTRSKALFDLAESAKKHVMDFAAEHGIDMDYLPGQMNVAHKPGYERDYQANAEIAAARYNYPHSTFMDRKETAERLGSTRYYCGVRDTGTGHIQPMKLLIGLANAARAAGAAIFENTPATAIRSGGGKVEIDTATGTITAGKALIATNAYIGGLEPVTAAHVMPIRSFIGATVPLDDFPNVIPGKEAVADSRFVVRYFRKTKDNRLLFGGREAYTADHPTDISAHIHRQVTEIYPALKDIAFTHAWGGSVGITLPRQPFAREVMPNVVSIGGYSGHGVMLSNYCGRLYAEAVLGRSPDLELLKELNVRAFPGGASLRAPLLFLALSWYALKDRL